MKNRFRILPYFTVLAGILGLCLRLWLFAATDEKGLLPAGHPADATLYILSAIVLAVLFLTSRKKPVAPGNRTLPGIFSIFAHIAGGLGLMANALLDYFAGVAGLAMIATVAGLLGGICLLCMAFCRKKLPYSLPAILCAALMLNTVAQCHAWGAEPQLQVYFFPLMACIFSILTAYHRTTLAAGTGKKSLLAFFSQSALFFCCVSLNTDHWALYLGLLFWSAAQLNVCYSTKKEA